MVKAALEAALEKTPLVIAALKRAAQAKAGRETAKDEVAVELQIKDKPKALPTSLANSNIPELWQIYRLRPRG